MTLAVEDDGLEVSSRWARVKMSPSAQDYLAALPPGTPLSRYTPERGTREHFAVIVAQVTPFYDGQTGPRSDSSVEDS